MCYVYYPSWPLDPKYTRTGVMLMVMMLESIVITHYNGKRYDEGYLLLLFVHHVTIVIIYPIHNPKPNTLITSQYITLLHLIILIQYSTTSYNPLQHSASTISKFILFCSFISICLSLFFLKYFLYPSMTNIHTAPHCMAQWCGPLVSYIIGLRRPCQHRCFQRSLMLPRSTMVLA